MNIRKLTATSLMGLACVTVFAVSGGARAEQMYPDGIYPDPSGNGMAERPHFDLYAESNQTPVHPRNWHERRREAEEEDFSLGNDIPALQGMQVVMVLNQLHHINLKEIQMAKLAESTAKTDDVLNLSHRIRADHEQLEKKVEALADRRGVTLEPFRLAEPEQAVMDRLKSLKGGEFETAYLRVNDRGHREAEHMLRLANRDSADPEVRGLIHDAMPMMMAHTMSIRDENRARAREESEELGE